MSEEFNNGGPAFQRPFRKDEARTRLEYAEDGMSMRDYFAAKAMQAFLSGHIAHYGHENHWPYTAMASDAYDVAAAMLKARQS